MTKLISGLVVLFVVQVSIIVGGEISAARADVSVMLPVDQLIIKYKEDANLTENESAMTENRMQQLNTATGVDMTYFRSMSGKAHVLRLPEKIQMNEAMQIAAKIAALPDVEYAEPDSIMLPNGKVADMPMVVPNDPMYGNQWHYGAPSAGNYGINAPGAWDISTGATGIYVAVLDTGIRNHADLAGRWQGGYDMISSDTSILTRDGDGRDSDPTDPGDWVASNACYPGSSSGNSSWHGTHVSGTIGAATNNGVGVAGINWISKIIPVRVLGGCGGMTSDIADAIRWAAGLSVPGVPNNPYPAKVINMSLGGYRTNGCADTPTYQSAVNDAYTAGSSVIVSAGNSNANVNQYVPASCSNVVAVAATNRNGSRAFYSNYGSLIKVSAPGGETNVSNVNGVLSTLNAGTQGPTTDNYVYYQGTSMAAPHVAGIASLLYSINPSLTPAQVLTYLRNSVTPFPVGSSCTTSNCGSGIVNAATAVIAAKGDLKRKPVIAPQNILLLGDIE